MKQNNVTGSVFVIKSLIIMGIYVRVVANPPLSFSPLTISTEGVMPTADNWGVVIKLWHGL